MNLDCFISIATCLVLSVAYVGSLYVWKTNENRDHPSTIKKRFFSVSVMMVVSPLFLYFATDETVFQRATLCELMGLRLNGLLLSSVLPLLLTMMLFLGPLSMRFYSGLYKLSSEPATNWSSNLKNLVWWRNCIVAPLSEEFTFRACMLPILLQSFTPAVAIFICPLFFGVAHFHHMIERIRNNVDFHSALLISVFQFTYTTLFGAYSAFLFVRSGHFVSSVVVHAFCNYMGFPNFQELKSYKGKERLTIVLLFIVGLTAWTYMLTTLTSPSLYSNKMLWKMPS